MIDFDEMPVLSEADRNAYLARTRLLRFKLASFERFRQLVKEGRNTEARFIWARLCRFHQQLVAITPHDRVVGDTTSEEQRACDEQVS